MPKVSIYSNKNHEGLLDKLSTTNCEELLYAHETTNEKYDTFLYTFKQAYLFSFPFKGLYGARSKDKKSITIDIRVIVEYKTTLYKSIYQSNW